MKIRTNLSMQQVRDALNSAINAAQVSPNVGFAVLEVSGKSRTHLHAYEVRLGCDSRADVVQDDRAKHRRPRSGTSYTDSHMRWGATYDEWGHFLAEVFSMDDTAVCGAYKSPDDFAEKTSYHFGA